MGVLEQAQTMPRSPMIRVSLGFAGVSVICLLVADIEVSTFDPWGEIGRMAHGLISPDFRAIDRLGSALLQTVAFALIGVALGAAIGFALALIFHLRAVRLGCAFVRSIHELFWALIFLQVFGLSPLTGLLAIAIPFGGIFAKLYSEILDEADQLPLKALPSGTGRVSAFIFVRLPDAGG